MQVSYFDQRGRFIAFRRHGEDKFLFDRNGRWIGWFAWGDADVVDKTGKYLGTVVGDRLVHLNRFFRGYPGFPGYPGFAGSPKVVSPPGYQTVAGGKPIAADRLIG